MNGSVYFCKMFLYMTAHNIHVSFSRLWFFQPVLRRDVGVVGKPPRSPVMSRRSCGSPVRGQNFSPSHRVGSMCTLCEIAHLTPGKFSFLSFQSIPAQRIMSFTVFDLGIHCLSAVLSILLLQLDIMILGMIQYILAYICVSVWPHDASVRSIIPSV